MQQHAHTQVRTDLPCTPSTIHAKKVLAIEQASAVIVLECVFFSIIRGSALQRLKEAPACLTSLGSRTWLRDSYLSPSTARARGLKQTGAETRSGPRHVSNSNRLPEIPFVACLHDAKLLAKTRSLK